MTRVPPALFSACRTCSAFVAWSALYFLETAEIVAVSRKFVICRTIADPRRANVSTGADLRLDDGGPW